MQAALNAVIRPSVCPLDCPDTCSLSVEVANEQVIAVRGSDANPYTAGVICDKVARYYPDFVHGDKRLRHPMRRVGPRGSGRYERIGWDQALDLVHEGLSQAIATHGPESVLPFNYAGPHGQLAGGSMDRRFFHRLGASHLNRGPLCGIVRGTAYTSLFGAAPGMAPEQFEHADLVAVWGNNVTVSNLHLTRVIKGERRPAVGHRSAAHQDRRAGRPVRADPPGDRCRAGAGAGGRIRAARRVGAGLHRTLGAPC
jgi:anaerobic selenocysteine-containing dehydrogenase